MLLTAEQYLDSIQKRGIVVHYRGEPVADVTEHPVSLR